MTKEQKEAFRQLLKSWDFLARHYDKYGNCILTLPQIEHLTKSQIQGIQLQANAKGLRDLLYDNFEDWSEPVGD